MRATVGAVRYERLPQLSHDEAEPLLAAALRGEPTDPDASSVLLGLAFHDDDRGFVEEWCVRLGRGAPDLWLRGSAALGVGYLAYRFDEVGDAAAALVRDLAEDESVLAVNGQPLDAANDLDTFLGPAWRDR